jgi:hypothetical protein
VVCHCGKCVLLRIPKCSTGLPEEVARFSGLPRCIDVCRTHLMMAERAAFQDVDHSRNRCGVW